MPRSEHDQLELEQPPVPPQIPRLDGIPIKPLPHPSELPPLQRSEPKEFELRPGDSGEDRPPQAPHSLAPLTEADRLAIASAEERLLQKELREAEELIASEPSVL